MKDLLFGSVLPGPFTAKDFRLFLQPLVGLLALFLAACETPGRIKDVKVPVVGESIVFGSANIYEKGKPQKSGMTLWGNQVVYFMILPPNTNKAFNYMITGDGKFNWTLAPGDYMVLGFKIWRSSGWRTGRIGATFSVPEGAGSVYIGTLEVRVEKGRYLFEVRDSSPVRRAPSESATRE